MSSEWSFATTSPARIDTGIIDDPNARALTNQFAGVVSGKLGRYPANQEPETRNHSPCAGAPPRQDGT